MHTITAPPGWSDLDDSERLGALINCVRTRKHVTFASKCFEHLGPASIEFLVQEIIDAKKSPAHRARLVEMIGVTGGSLSIRQAGTLVNHQLCRGKTVRRSVIRLFEKLESEGRTLEGNPPGWRCPGGPSGLIRLLEGKLPEGTHERSKK